MKDKKVARLLKAVEAFMELRTSIFPSVSGSQECAALDELEEALVAAGGKVPYNEGAESLDA